MELGTVALIGVVLLAIAFAIGIYQNSRRDRRKDWEREAATRELYREENDPATGGPPT